MQDLSSWPVIARRTRLIGLLSSSIIAITAIAQNAAAQSTNPAPAPPIASPVDSNGVNLATGSPTISLPALTIGKGPDSALDFHSIFNNNNVLISSYYVALEFATVGQTSTAIVMIGDKSVDFKVSGGFYTASDGNGETLVTASGGYTYTARDGTIINFTTSIDAKGQASYNGVVAAVASSMVAPNGATINFYYYEADVSCGGDCIFSYFRLQAIQNTSGNLLSFTYGANSLGLPKNQSANLVLWLQLNQVQAINTAVDYCNPTAVSCGTLAHSWPTLTYSYTTSGSNYVTSIKDANGFPTSATLNSLSQLINLTTPSSNNITYVYDSNYRVASLVRNGVSYTYAFSKSGNNLLNTLTGPNGQIDKSVADTTTGSLLSFVDAYGNTTGYSEDAYGRINQVSHPEGNYETYQYDGRGNVTQKTMVSKTPGTPANIVTTAGYDATCANAVKCNQPNWAKDAVGNETDYTYDPTSGLLTSVTSPPDPNNLRPQVRYTYTPMQGYFYVNSGSSIVASGVNTSELTQTSVCRTTAGAGLSGTPGQGPFSLSGTASCAGASDETRTTIGYGPQTEGTANNLYLLSQTVAAGDNSLSAVNSQAYDNFGNVVSTVGPLGSGQTTITYFDADRRQLGNVWPVPGGIGSPVPTAVKYTYNYDGVLTETQIGTVPDQTANSWTNSFTEAYHTIIKLDSYDRPIRQATANVSGSTNYAISDQLYDNVGRAYCTIQYMNLGSVGGEATSCAPTQTTGSFGPDRVTQTTYDNDNRVTALQRGVGTGAAATEQSAYSPNGNVSYVIDGMNNRTAYTYDGFDRLSVTNFPLVTQGSNGGDTNNYEQLTYNANSAVTQERQRDGSTISPTYDNLNRTRTIVRSDGSTVTYTYNLINLPTNITRSSDSSTLTFAYDALGRLTTEGQPYGSMSYGYDAAGDRKQITWPDGFYVNYTYDYNQNVSQIEENGATSGVGLLAQYTYDGLGRRTNVAYGNGSSRGYSYDPVSRLSSIQLTFPSASTYNDTIGPLTYTPSSQIATITKSNDAFAWTGHIAVTRPYTTNGLNQYTVSGSQSLGYDGRGNLNASGGTAYTYNVLNQMTAGPNATIGYDDIGRLFQYVTSSLTTDFYYTGSALVTETNGTSITQRYVPGPGTDEPIVWYSGGTTAGREFLQADERGSVIAVTNSSGAMVGVNSYDEFGIPASSNIGRLQYTGQTWFREVGLYNYKTRWYSPTLGRFMQTDPIGYGDGLNFYNYTHSDPVNGSDPSGFDDIVVIGNLPISGGLGDESGPETIVAIDPKVLQLYEGGPVATLKYLPPRTDEAAADAACAADPQSCIVVTGSQRGGNNQLQSEFEGWSVEDLQKELKTATGTYKQKLIKQLKALGVRNASKVRGGPIINRLPFPFIIIPPDTDIILKLLDCSSAATSTSGCSTT